MKAISKGYLANSALGRISRHGIVTLAAFVLSSCGIAPKTESPIPTITQLSADNKNRSLIVMLPGRGDRAESFRTAGFFDAVDPDKLDIISVDAHFGYYKEGNLVSRLHNDVITPAIEGGYENIWLLGISMGGMGSLLYADQHPEVVSGVVLLAPYLGDPGLVAEIEAAGGLASWIPDESSFKAREVAVWKWLKNTRSGPTSVPVFLGYGNSDRFAGNYRALQSDVAGLQIYTEDGGHKWSIWSRLWSRIYLDLSTR